ncbi:hypothetical protein [Clostridium sp. ZS2-4]|uniref:hypothetical protein n=1 Tax=Clostridium sp. ZS2-4 TaxID=2987703 RepID=UPI00227C6476|nr:hypothetical protein [Clostridium sp. ZS2-4]MCY6354941.1 hypothetical protein [Clostridium sp. ZS2-4]
MKKLKAIIILILSLICIIILSVGSFVLIGAIQAKLFLPKEYIMWIFKSPSLRLVFIYEWYIIFGFAYIFSKDLRAFILWVINSKQSFIKRHKMSFIFTFVILNIVLMYTILYNVTVITNNKIINYTFLSPQGKEYGYNDIVKIDTGVYGKKQYTHSKGDFYYIIQLNDGTKIDLTEMGGAKNDDDPRFIIEKLDSQYVNMGISKVSSMDNFEYCTKHLDKIYTDKIRNILVNIK